MLHKVRLPLTLLVLLCPIGATITFFQVVFDGNTVRVAWEMGNESSMLGYDLYRKTTNDASFERLTTIPPTGQSWYQSQDNDVFRGAGRRPVHLPAHRPNYHRRPKLHEYAKPDA